MRLGDLDVEPDEPVRVAGARLDIGRAAFGIAGPSELTRRVMTSGPGRAWAAAVDVSVAAASNADTIAMRTRERKGRSRYQNCRNVRFKRPVRPSAGGPVPGRIPLTP